MKDAKKELLRALHKLDNNVAWARMQVESDNMNDDDLHQIYLSYEQVATKGAVYVSNKNTIRIVTERISG